MDGVLSIQERAKTASKYDESTLLLKFGGGRVDTIGEMLGPYVFLNVNNCHYWSVRSLAHLFLLRKYR